MKRSSTLDNPRIETRGSFVIAGLNQSYKGEAGHLIPMQWQRFMPLIGHVTGQVGNTAYGVGYNFRNGVDWDFLAGVEVADGSPVDQGLTHFRVPEQKYAVFRHKGHVASIDRTWTAIMQEWLPKSPYRMTKGPTLERYGEEFNGQTGLGGFELWIPIEDKR
jgi:AraC family transcriptional regulator